MVKGRLLRVVLGLCLAAGFASLGRWQLGREQEKRALLAAADAALAAAPVALGDALARPGAAPVQAAGDAVFLATPALWLDNQRRGPAVGVRQYCAASAGGGTPFLVDLGWLPLPPDRRLPGVACPSGTHALAGLSVPPPAPGLALGEGLAAQDGAWLALSVDPARVAAAFGVPALSPRVLRLDPLLPLGHARDLDLLPNTLPPEKHRGYAVQWFGLSAATVVVVLLLALRRARP